MNSQSALCNIIFPNRLSQTSLLKEILYLQTVFYFWKTAGLTPYLFFKKQKECAYISPLISFWTYSHTLVFAFNMHFKSIFFSARDIKLFLLPCMFPVLMNTKYFFLFLKNKVIMSSFLHGSGKISPIPK